MRYRSLKERGAALRRLALSTLETAGVVGTEILTAPIVDYRQLLWIAPPIYPAVVVSDDTPTMFVNGTLEAASNTELQQAYNRTLNLFLESPKAALSDDFSYVAEAATVFGMDDSIARAIFSAPAVESRITGDTVGPEASYTFAMEFAAACLAAGKGYQYRSADDFFVLDGGLAVGIRNGRVIGFEEQFPEDISSYVEAYLTMPRGAGWTENTFDILDRLHFWVEREVLDRPDLESLLYLLPYLKTCSDPDDLYRLEQAIFRLQGAKPEAKVDLMKPQRLDVEEYFRRVDAAIAVVIDIRIPDSDKVNTIMDLLVPLVVAEGTFTKSWYTLNNGVITLSKRQQDRLLNNLIKLRDKPLKRYKRRAKNVK